MMQAIIMALISCHHLLPLPAFCHPIMENYHALPYKPFPELQARTSAHQGFFKENKALRLDEDLHSGPVFKVETTFTDRLAPVIQPFDLANHFSIYPLSSSGTPVGRYLQSCKPALSYTRKSVPPPDRLSQNARGMNRSHSKTKHNSLTKSIKTRKFPHVYLDYPQSILESKSTAMKISPKVDRSFQMSTVMPHLSQSPKSVEDGAGFKFWHDCVKMGTEKVFLIEKQKQHTVENGVVWKSQSVPSEGIEEVAQNWHDVSSREFKAASPKEHIPPF